MNALDVVDHFAIHVADIQKSIRWYTTSFECEVVFEDRTMAVLQFANIRLALVLPSQDPPHFAIPRADAQALGELRDRADGSRSTFISDPTGNVVEIAAPISKYPPEVPS